MSDYTTGSASDDEISLRPYFDAVWRYRRVVGLSLVGAAALCAFVTVIIYVLLPKERVASIQVRMLFDGAAAGRYANGTTFNPTEIVATPVLTAVFASNDLKRYTSFQDFQQAMFVLQSNPALQRLDDEYRAKLSDTKLAPVDRAKLEDDFGRRRDAIRDPQYSVNLNRSERFAEMPRVLIEKILSQTIEEWANQADAQKGAARPDIDIVSPDLFSRASVENENFLVRVDVLRTGAQRIINALAQLQKVPGARTVRTGEHRTLSDELATVEGILKFDVEPLMGMARLSGVTDRVFLQSYVSNQLTRYRLDYREASTRAQSLQTSLREYMAQRGGHLDNAAAGAPAAPAQGSAPQNPGPGVPLSDAFIDRLLEMSAATQVPEMEFRRSLTEKYIAAQDQLAIAEREIGYYEELQKQLAMPSPVNGAAGAEILSARFTRVFDELRQSVSQVQKLYDEVSAQTMNPSRRLYTVTQPFSLQTLSSVQWTRIVLAFVSTMLLTLFAAIVGVLVHTTSHPKSDDVPPTMASRSSGGVGQTLPAVESSARV